MTNYLTANGVQYFTITIASSSTTGTATITAVGSLAFILRGGENPSATANAAEGQASVTLTNSTTVTATRNLGTAGTIVVKGCVVDATSALVKSVQYGTVSIAAGAGTVSGTATVTAVTDANAAIEYLGLQNSDSSLGANFSYARVSQSGTTVTATRASGSSSAALVVGFCLVEFQPGVLNQSVQRVSATSSSAVTSFTASITSVVTSNALTFFGGSTIATVTTDLAEAFMYGAISSATVFQVNVNTADAVAKTYNASVVEFVSGILNSSVQRGTTTLTGVTSNTSTITSVTAADAAFSWLGNTSNLTSAVLEDAAGAGTLTNGRLLR